MHVQADQNRDCISGIAKCQAVSLGGNEETTASAFEGEFWTGAIRF